MYKDASDAFEDVCEIRALYKTLFYAYAYCEENDIYPFSLVSLGRIIDNKIENCIHDFDNFLTHDS